MEASEILRDLVQDDYYGSSYTRLFQDDRYSCADYSQQYVVNTKAHKLQMLIASGMEYNVLDNCDTLVIPIFWTLKNRVKCGTFTNGILSAIIKCNIYEHNHKLAAITISNSSPDNGKTFYCGRGIILNSDRMPVFVVLDDLIYNEQTRKYDIVGCTIKVHPMVFTNEGLLYKNIRTAIIPEILKLKRRANCTTQFFSKNNYEVPIRMEVDEAITKLFSPAEPPTMSFTSEEVNNYIEHASYDC